MKSRKRGDRRSKTPSRQIAPSKFPARETMPASPSDAAASRPANPHLAGGQSSDPARPSNPKAADLAMHREDSAGQVLTTNQGMPRQRQPEHAEGGRARAVAARGLPPPREDHPLRPRAHPRARRARARLRARTASSRSTRSLARYTQAALPAGPVGAHAGLRALLDGRRLARLDRHGARRARLRDQVLHGGGQLRPRRQQHAGLLHPGRDQVPGPRSTP